MLQIHVDHIAAAERVLAALEDSSADLFRVARHVSAIPELGRRMTEQASDRARRPVRLVASPSGQGSCSISCAPSRMAR